MRYSVFIIFVLFCFFPFFSQNKKLDLNSTWQFKQADSVNWLPAKVPGNVVNDLLNAGRIKDPYVSENINSLDWIGEKDWHYKTIFKCDADVLKNQHLELVFEGIDTHADVFLNDSLILHAHNMFREWKVDVKQLLKLGKNELRLVFKSALKYGQEEASKLPYVLPEEERVYSRKAQFQYGWDFSPRLLTCGIWKSVYLNVWNDIHLTSIQYQLKKLTDTLAKVNFIIEMNCETAGNYSLNLSLQEDISDSKKEFNKSLALNVNKGMLSDTFHLDIPKPNLWWTNGIGKASLYTVSVSLIQHSKKIETSTLSIGIRTLELVQEKDERGVSFYFKLNHVPVFMKGANYVPHDVLLRSKTEQAYHTELQSIKQKHMNMLRVWGGGVYPDDAFYKACDRAGILVWQDFMFAGAMYPSDSAFMKNVKEEITQQLKKYRNHSSLALWCGNNEIDEAWNNWGWQKQFKYSQNDSAKIWHDYQNLFREEIRSLTQQLDPDRPYWSSSPSIGWGRKESLTQGDSHYWGVWWGMQPFEVYEKKVGRFMSEYGFQSLPDFVSLKKFCPDSQLNLNSKTLLAHQKHKKGFETIQSYLEWNYKTPKGLQNYCYVSQLVQRDGMQIAIEAHRRNKPFCMGTLFWQLNDSWPGITWSAIDYDQQPKALFYSLESLYKTHLISVKQTDSIYKVFLVSDSLQSFNGEVHIAMKNFKSETLWQKKYSCALNNTVVFKINQTKNEVPIQDSGTYYFKIELHSQGNLLASKTYFPHSTLYTKLLKANIRIKKVGESDYEVSSDVFAKDVYLYDEKHAVIFSDNYFNLEAGETKRIKRVSKLEKNEVVELKAITLNNL